MEAHRQVTRRDARLEGEPDAEPSGGELPAAEQAEKDAQRDLTSLSTHVPRSEEERSENED